MTDYREITTSEAISTFKSLPNAKLAVMVAEHLAKRGYGCAVTESDDGVISVTYGENRGEGHTYPPILIDNGKIRMPTGTSFDLFEILLGEPDMN